MRSAIVGLVLIAIATGAVVYLARSPAAAPPNVLLVTVDTLRADHLGLYGYDRATSPHIDQVAAEGFVFDRAFTQATLSGPSHATLMTSLSPIAHETPRNAIDLQSRLITLAEVMQGAGYDTAMFVSDELLSDQFGFDQGFATSELHAINPHGAHHAHARGRDEDEDDDYATATAVFDAALDWLRKPRTAPWFVWLHALHPHKSYDPPPPWDAKFGEVDSDHDLRCMYKVNRHRSGRIDLSSAELDQVIALYDGEIAYTDDQLGRVFAAVRELDPDDNTVIVLLADHGEMLFEDADRRLVGHGGYRTDTVLRIPLIFAGPLPTAGRSEALVDAGDVAPTIVDLAGIEVPASWRGESLLPLMRGEVDGLREAVFSVTYHSDEIWRFATRTDQWKLEVNTRDGREGYQLFDLDKDPDEHHDVSDDPAYAEDLKTIIDATRAWFDGEEAALSEMEKAPDAHGRELLEKAGYLPQSEKTPEPR